MHRERSWRYRLSHEWAIRHPLNSRERERGGIELKARLVDRDANFSYYACEPFFARFQAFIPSSLLIQETTRGKIKLSHAIDEKTKRERQFHPVHERLCNKNHICYIKEEGGGWGKIVKKKKTPVTRLVCVTCFISVLKFSHFVSFQSWGKLFSDTVFFFFFFLVWYCRR